MSLYFPVFCTEHVAVVVEPIHYLATGIPLLQSGMPVH